jgi:hypothetical protein
MPEDFILRAEGFRLAKLGRMLLWIASELENCERGRRRQFLDWQGTAPKAAQAGSTACNSKRPRLHDEH